MLQSRDGHSRLPGARTQTQVFLPWKMRKVGFKCIAIFPNMSKCTRGVGERGGWGTPWMLPTHIWCNQGLDTPVFQGLKLRHLLHMRDGVAAKRRSGFERASSYPCSCFLTWAPLYPLIMGLESALISAVSNCLSLSSTGSHLNHFWKTLLFEKFENKRKRKDPCAHKCWQTIATVFFYKDGYSPKNLHSPDLESAAQKILCG